MVGDSSCQERLARTRWAVQQDTLGLGDAQGVEEFRVLDGQLDDFLEWCRIGYLLNTPLRLLEICNKVLATSMNIHISTKIKLKVLTMLINQYSFIYLDFLDLLVEPSNHLISGIGHLFDHHK